MAEQKTREEPKAPPVATPAPKPAPAPLGAAGESGNPEVHQVLAELAIAVSNGTPVGEYERRLAELGVAV